MDDIPVFLNLTGQRCLVVGGGKLARRKVDLLLRAGGHVALVAPWLDATLAQWVTAGRLAHSPEPFSPPCLEGAAIVIAATGEAAVNRAVAQEARRRGIPVSVVAGPADSTFIVPAIVDRFPLEVAISSGGRAPVLARRFKARLERVITHGYGTLANLAGDMRELVAARIPAGPRRRRFWERVFQGRVARLALAGLEREARQALVPELTAAGAVPDTVGSVALVGAGPGDPELLTLRAARLLQQADVIVHDRLVSSEVLEMARGDAERVDVGKAVGHATNSQQEINALLIRLAKQGNRVVRLKGGDPFIFGRGGEELQAVAEAGIRCEVVPGITAAAGCAARFGIPLTDRAHAHSVVLVTGHPRRGGSPALPPVAPDQTLVVYMGVSRLGEICAELIAQGLSLDTPVALVQEGTTQRERMITGTLATIPVQAAAQDIRPPALLFVGKVVTCQDSPSVTEMPGPIRPSTGKGATDPVEATDPFTLG